MPQQDSLRIYDVCTRYAPQAESELAALRASATSAEEKLAKAEAELKDANQQRERMAEHLDKVEVSALVNFTLCA